MNYTTITKPKITNGFRSLEIIPLNIENVHLSGVSA